MSDQIRAIILRGGTSKGVYLHEEDLPIQAASREKVILKIFGSPDKRQIDGLGGADPLTSKICIIGPPPADAPGAVSADISYTFGQVEINEPHVDFRSLCGNLTSGVGAFAIWEKLVEITEPLTRVKIYNTNLKRMLYAEVPVKDGVPLETGEYAIPGVPGTGAKIEVDFADTAGASTGALLPTGNPRDDLRVPGIGTLEVSMVDIGNPHVFVRASDLGLKGSETAAEIDINSELCNVLEDIRSYAGVAMGIIDNAAYARVSSPAVPFVAMVSRPQDYQNIIDDCIVRTEKSDFLSRVMFMQQMHKTYAGTSTVCTGVASRIADSVVNEVCRRGSLQDDKVRFGHPAGIIQTEARVKREGNNFSVERATLGRTARRIMDGTVYL